MTGPVVSVVVPVFNHRDKLSVCVRCLTAQTYPGERIELLIVDNNPDGGARTIASADALPGAFRASSRVLHEPAPGSYAARNRGVREATGEILAFTDADCEPAADWIERAVAHFLDDPDCAMIGGRVEPTFRDPRKPSLLETYESVTGLQQKTYLESWGFAATANMLARRRAFDVVGPFDASLKSGGDLEWGQRVRASGLGQIYAEDVVVHHPARRTWREVLTRAVRIAGGLQDVSRKRGVRAWAAAHEIWKDSVPVRSLARHLRDERLDGPARKLGFAGVFWILGVVRAAERLRVGLGGSSRRT